VDEKHGLTDFGVWDWVISISSDRLKGTDLWVHYRPFYAAVVPLHSAFFRFERLARLAAVVPQQDLGGLAA
jgi:hypothetical protein